MPNVVGRIPGEPVFAPAKGDKSEDDGSRFVVIDAASMDATPIASVALPRIPHGFHGSWIPTSVAD